VTGAGRGIGAALARIMAAEGCAVLVDDLGVAVDGTGAESGPVESPPPLRRRPSRGEPTWQRRTLSSGS